jgi:hypothetical protein
MRKQRLMFRVTTAVVALFVIVVIGFVIAGGVVSNTNHATVTCTVTGKDHSIDKNNNPVYRVYTSGNSDCTTFDIADSALFGNFNSADLYGKIQEKETYRFETSGVRNGFLSLFPVIHSASKVGS